MSIWRPATTGILIGGIVLVVVAAAVAFAMMNFQPKVEVRLGSGVYHLKIANDQPTREIGLSSVDKLQPDEGLLMVFDSDSKWGIWMKDMKVPIDILWLDKDKKIVYIVKNVSPDLSTDKTFEPTKPARYVIELSAGSVQQSGIRVGDSATFELGEVQ